MFNKESSELKQLYKAVISLESEEECAAFFYDICTIQELESLSQRLDVALRLDEGKNYNDVHDITGASTATICRVSKCLNYGEGGYKTVIDRLKRG